MKTHTQFIQPAFKTLERGTHLFYFEDRCWLITKDAIKDLDYTAIQHPWQVDLQKDFLARRLPKPLTRIYRDESGRFFYTITPTGQQSHFLRFLENTSNFTWRKQQLINEGKSDVVITPDELYDNTLHLIAKLCAIGYLLVSAKDRREARAVIAMDGKQSEVRACIGRSGKTLVGDLLRHVTPSLRINGKTVDLEDDKFVWNELTEKTRIVFIDDVRPGFNFELLFADITGDWSINRKGGPNCILPFCFSPKIYLATNYALRGEGASFFDRQWIIVFSDYYNDKHCPVDDFGLYFFEEWDFSQWNLTWNLLAECVQLYFRYGCIQSPQ